MQDLSHLTTSRVILPSYALAMAIAFAFAQKKGFGSWCFALKHSQNRNEDKSKTMPHHERKLLHLLSASGPRIHWM
jgi:hypothetical protein